MSQAGRGKKRGKKRHNVPWETPLKSVKKQNTRPSKEGGQKKRVPRKRWKEGKTCSQIRWTREKKL